MALSPSTRQTLQDIIALTQKHHQTTEFSQLPTDDDAYAAPSNILPPPLSLGGITAQLESKMINAGISSQLQQLALQQASKVVSTYEDLYRKASRHLLVTPIVHKGDAIAGLDILRRRFEHSYEHRDIVEFYNRVSAAHLSLRVSPYPAKPAEQALKSFNHVCHFFSFTGSDLTIFIGFYSISGSISEAKRFSKYC